MEAAFERNGQSVSRDEFYRIACDPQRSVAVEACAGAGKTWMLVSRIVRALLEGAAPHEILAITFTKKAAGEMRQRLLEWLQAFARASPQELEQQLVLRGVSPSDAPAQSELLRQLHGQLLAQGRPVQIRTFHSWFAALLRNAPLSVLESLGLPAAYELLEDDALAVAQVWRPFQARLLREPALLADYYAVVATHGRFQTDNALTAALQRRIEFVLADRAGRASSSVSEFGAVFPEWARFALPTACLNSEPTRQRWLEWARQLGRESNKTPQKAAALVLDALALAEAAAQTDPLDEAALGKALASLRAALFVSNEDRLTHHLKKFAAAQEAEVALQRLSAAQRQHEAWLYQQRMVRLTRALVSEYAVLKRQHGWVDMSDVEHAALHLLSDPVTGAWVQERLDARTRHLLIDEFQDTNPLQWQALHAWLSSYAGAVGGSVPTVFIVGDPKQSIYRFRRAEPQVFRAAQKFVRELGGDQLSCDHTRRNAPKVLGIINQTMRQAQSAGQYSDFRVHTTESLRDGGVSALPQLARAKSESEGQSHEVWRDTLCTPRITPEETLRTLECRQAAHWLAQRIAAGLPAREIMVLARKRDRLRTMQDELRAIGIAACQPEKTNLNAMPEVQDIVALLDALVSPTHDLSLARALKSPVFGIADQDLMILASQQRESSHKSKKSWFEILQTADQLPPALQAVGLRLRRWKDWLDTLPPHDALDAIYSDGDVLARFAAALPVSQREAGIANLQALLNAALQIDGARYATPYAFVRALKTGAVKAPQLAQDDAVRLLTVHGAKGLEAELVLLLDTDAPAQRAQTMGLLLDWPGQAEVPQSFVFLASETQPPPSVVDLLALEQQARQREELNALYVAMTRAQGQLVLSSVQAHQPDAGSWWQRIHAHGPILALSAAPLNKSERDQTSVVTDTIVLLVLPTLQAVSSLGSMPLAAPASVTTESADSRIGQAMHRLLEWANAAETGGATRWRETQIGRVAEEFGLTPVQVARAADMATRILEGQGAWAWRLSELDWHANEVPISIQGRVRRIDRLVRRRTGDWWVFDYKSAAQPQASEDLLVQLRSYRIAVQAVYPDQPVRAAFLSAQGSLEEIE